MRIVYIAILLFCLLPIESACAKGIAFHTSVDGFSIELPAGWVQIPRSVINKTVGIVSSKFPRARPFTPSYAFQGAHTGSWFSYPYVLVSVKRVGRPSEAEIRESVSTSYSNVGRDITEKFTNMNSFAIGKPIYDKKTKAVWLYAKTQIKNHGEISGFMVTIPTSYGFVKISGFAKSETFWSFLPKFVGIINSFRADLGTKY